MTKAPEKNGVCKQCMVCSSDICVQCFACGSMLLTSLMCSSLIYSKIWVMAIFCFRCSHRNLFASRNCLEQLLIQVLDVSYKGCVDWKKVVKNPGTMYKRLENCMMAVTTAKEVRSQM